MCTGDGMGGRPRQFEYPSGGMTEMPDDYYVDVGQRGQDRQQQQLAGNYKLYIVLAIILGSLILILICILSLLW